MGRGPLVAAVALAGALPWLASCGPDLDLAKVLQITPVQSGYYDAGLRDGKTLLLPQITLSLKNVSPDSLSSVQLFVSFWQEGKDGAIDDDILSGIGPTALPPGQTAEPLVVRCPHGYTLDGARADTFTNSVFLDVIAKVFAKKRAGYVKMGEFKLERRILEPSGKAPGRP